MRFMPISRMVWVSLFLIFYSSQAFAFDAAEYVSKFQKMASERGVTVSYGSMEAVGNAGFVLNDVSVQGPQGNPPAKIAQIRIEGIEELSGNSFAAKLLQFEEFSLVSTTAEKKEVIVTVAGGSGKDLYFADPAETDAPFIYYPKTTYGMKDLTVSLDGNTLLTINSFSTDMDFNPETKNLQFDLGVNDIDVNLELGEDARFNARRKALGYDHLMVNVELSGQWDMKSGKVEISNYSFDAKDAGKLAIAVAISGYTEELALRFRTLSGELQTETDPKERQKKNIALLGMMSQLSLDNMSLDYTDASLTNRILTLQANQMGMPKEELAKMLPAMLPIVAAPLQNPEFIGSLAGNVAKFLSNPGSFSIIANPSRSIPLTEIMIAGSTQPHTLINLLGVEVKSNECTATC